ncbi:MAG TPA: XRE family transcriptional regulator [Stellaceae bacterium]|nr:XRE family transcriptional regulator [Stellaceae bacterium]
MTNVLPLFGRSAPRLLPARLREARESKELSMSDLGDAIGLTRQAISFYESGEREPDPEMLMKIIGVLEQPISFFTTDRPRSFGRRGTTFFRSFKSKTKRTNRRCEVLSDWFAQTASFLDEFVNFPAVDLSEIAPPKQGQYYSDDEIEAAAAAVRRHWGLGDGPIADVVGLMESRGVIVARSDFGTDTVSAFSFWEGGRPFIFLGADKESAARSRFDAAHELAHLCLHRGVETQELELDLDQVENEADRFASAFLLPAPTYSLEIFSTRLGAFVELKRRWKVSIAAQIFRCLDLSILSEMQALNLRKQLSAHHWRKHEPLDDVLPIEKPRVMEKALWLLLDHNVRTVSDILDGIRLSRPTIEALLATTLPASVEGQLADMGPRLR